ncbi:NfeD family protein [Paenibacillus pinistramenti]|uniref:NfeD family protein n=1 Tax=Paenibacillus pinistramenti TaxID=1768003 RepID=UPI001108EBC3|nr:NfeD family protein [Paenibacillus pinistramenti]
MHAWVIWLIAAGVLLVLEMFTLTFYLLWICIGAVTALLVSLAAPDLVLLQVIAGSIVALVLTVFTKPLSRRLRSSRGYEDPGTELIGRQGIVIEPIEPGHYGIVKIGGDTWSATAPVFLGKEERVRVMKMSSTRVEVVKWEEI